MNNMSANMATTCRKFAIGNGLIKMKILVLNSGSSSQKACLFDLGSLLPDDPPQPLWEGKLEWRDDRATLEARTASGAVAKENVEPGERSAATSHLLNELASGKTRVLESLSEIDVVGHRIVNGGRAYNRPTLITPDVESAIEKMAVFAPLHNRLELDGIALIETLCENRICEFPAPPIHKGRDRWPRHPAGCCENRYQRRRPSELRRDIFQ